MLLTLLRTSCEVIVMRLPLVLTWPRITARELLAVVFFVTLRIAGLYIYPVHTILAYQRPYLTRRSSV